MNEFGLEPEDHIRLPVAPQKLLLMTIGMLGDLCRMELDEKDHEVAISQARLELRNAASYFDNLVKTELETGYDYYLSLLASAAYYLADMPGSSSVIASRLASLSTELTDTGLEFFLEWILIGKFRIPPKIASNSSYKSLMISLATELNVYFNPLNARDDSAISISERIRERVHDSGTDRDILFSDIITAIVNKKISNSSMEMLPKYTGLMIEDWLPALQKRSFIKEFWPAQRLLGEGGVFIGKSSVIQLPTSAGKTKSTELIIRSSFLSGRSTVAVIIAPFRSLCREISSSLSIAFSDENVLVNQLNDIPQIDEFDLQLFEQLFEQEIDNVSIPTVMVATPEKLVYLLRHKPELSEKISLVIYDEGHQFDTGARGVTYELLVTSLKRKLGSGTQHVLISAVLSNAQSIGDWLYAGEGSVVNGAECLSTERSIAFCSWIRGRGEFHYVKPFDINSEEFYVPRVMEALKIPKADEDDKQQFFPPKSDKSLVAAYLGLKLSKYGPVAVFCGQKSSVIKICREVIKPLELIPQLDSPLVYSVQDEIEKIGNLSALHLGLNADVTKSIQLGVLPHSANIPNGLRISVEYAMENGLGRCVICTSTLAQGVNLPIKYLVMSGVFQGKKLISTRDFHNLLGRAGRAGKHTEGSIIFADTELFDQRRSKKSRQWEQMNILLDPSKSEACSSSLLTLVQPFTDDPFPVDPMKFLDSPDKYEKLLIQAAERQGLDISNLLNQMHQRIRYVESLESFLLANLNDEEMNDDVALTELYSKTFAFSIANVEEKRKLVQVFRNVEDKVKLLPVEKRLCYGKALLGIRDLEYIETWLRKNIELFDEELDIFSLLSLFWPLIAYLGTNNSLGKLIGEDAGRSVAIWWCSGDSYNNILLNAKRDGFKFRAGKQQRTLKIENIIDICDSSLGYDVMLVVGACADLLENLLGNPPVAELVKQLQTSLKIGLCDSLAVDLYANGLADRVVAKNISELLVLNGINSNIPTKIMLRDNQNLIQQRLSEFPSVFTHSVFAS
nr:DEAD/DEAH box helicase [Vibrio eleionomae]